MKINIPNNQFTKQSLADSLYEVYFAINEEVKGALRKDFNKSINLEKLNLKENFDTECNLLSAFLVTFTFQETCDYLDKDSIKIVLDVFHIKLIENNPASIKGQSFTEMINTRYDEYHPIMIEELGILETGSKDIILFRKIIDSFFNKIVPEKTRSGEALLFSLFFAKLYKLLYETFNNFKKNIIL